MRKLLICGLLLALFLLMLAPLPVGATTEELPSGDVVINNTAIAPEGTPKKTVKFVEATTAMDFTEVASPGIWDISPPKKK